MVAGESASTETVSFRFVKIETTRRGPWQVQPNGDHTAWTRYAAHRARLAIDLRAVLLASGQRQLGAALRAGDERALTLSGRQASLSSTLAETRELGT